VSADNSQTIRILALDHVQIAMPAGREDDARRFYRDLLGMDELPKPEALVRRGGAWFGAGSTMIHLGVEQEFHPARKAHPALLVADLAALRARLQSAGVALVDDDSLPGMRRFYASDPFGNRIEFIQDGDGFSQTPPPPGHKLELV